MHCFILLFVFNFRFLISANKRFHSFINSLYVCMCTCVVVVVVAVE